MPRPGYVFPLALGSTHMAGSPRSINQSFGARCPQSPRQVRWLLMLVASPPMAGFSNSGRLATCIGVTRPNRVNLRYGSHLRLRRLRRSDYSDLTHTTLRRLHVERAIHMASSFHLAGLATAWRTRDTETQRNGGGDRSQSRSRGRSTTDGRRQATGRGELLHAAFAASWAATARGTATLFRAVGRSCWPRRLGATEFKRSARVQARRIPSPCSLGYYLCGENRSEPVEVHMRLDRDDDRSERAVPLCVLRALCVSVAALRRRSFMPTEGDSAPG